ncbi:citrulline utilization hydrolase CtlX [Sphingobacterium spiritivorum]
MRQTTDTLLMIRPASFRKNEQTSINNYFQHTIPGWSAEHINTSAQQEFDNFVSLLKQHDIRLIVVQDDGQHDTPDSIFPNNWISFHENGEVVLYPMFAENRRNERKIDVFAALKEAGYAVTDRRDFTSSENQHLFLEGTGSLILDRVNRKAYCSLSPRADSDLVHRFCLTMDYTPVLFESFQSVGDLRKAIYHTNVMMAVGDHFAVLCADAIDNKLQRQLVIDNLHQDNKEIVFITEEQACRFAGNILQVHSVSGASFVVMSNQAYDCLLPIQIDMLSQYGTLLKSPLNVIETCGGGSARCMMAEVFLPQQTIS